jgi:hypothetical protein
VALLGSVPLQPSVCSRLSAAKTNDDVIANSIRTFEGSGF